MTPGRYDLDLYRGDSYHWRFVLFSDDAEQVPTNLTGATAAAEIREKSAGVVVVELTTTITQPNWVDVVMAPDQFVNCPSKGVWDMQVTLPDGQVMTPVRGDVTVTGDVTDSLVMPVRARR